MNNEQDRIGAIRARLARYITLEHVVAGDRWDIDWPWDNPVEMNHIIDILLVDAPHLLAEVERLRGERDAARFAMDQVNPERRAYLELAERLRHELITVTAERDALAARLALSEAVVKDGCEMHTEALAASERRVAALVDAVSAYLAAGRAHVAVLDGPRGEDWMNRVNAASQSNLEALEKMRAALAAAATPEGSHQCSNCPDPEMAGLSSREMLEARRAAAATGGDDGE